MEGRSTPQATTPCRFPKPCGSLLLTSLKKEDKVTTTSTGHPQRRGHASPPLHLHALWNQDSGKPSAGPQGGPWEADVPSQQSYPPHPLSRRGPPRHLSAQGGTEAVVERQDAVGAHHLQRHARHAQLHLLLCLQVHLRGGGPTAAQNRPRPRAHPVQLCSEPFPTTHHCYTHMRTPWAECYQHPSLEMGN